MLSISLCLRDRTKELCSILPYFGSAHYVYENLPLGLVISPQVWITYLGKSFRRNPQQSYIATMYDLLLHGLKSDQMALCEYLLKSLILHGLKFSPRKYQLCIKNLVYLGNVFHIEDGVITITLMQSRIEAIQQLPPSTTVNECNSF